MTPKSPTSPETPTTISLSVVEQIASARSIGHSLTAVVCFGTGPLVAGSRRRARGGCKLYSVVVAVVWRKGDPETDAVCSELPLIVVKVLEALVENSREDARSGVD